MCLRTRIIKYNLPITNSSWIVEAGVTCLTALERYMFVKFSALSVSEVAMDSKEGSKVHVLVETT